MKATANDGREFRLVLSPLPGNRLPKRAGSVDAIVNGTPMKCPVTSNRGWSVDAEKTLEYIWIDVSGKAYYLTLDYAEKAANGMEFTVTEGTASRADPARVGKAEKEAARIAAFKATWAARNA